MNTEKKKHSIKKAWYYVPLFQVPNSDHPLFRLIRKRIKWAKTHEDAKRHSWRFVGRLVVGILLLWILWTLTQVPPVVLSNQTRYWESGVDGIFRLFLFSLLLSYILDVLTIIYTILSFNTEIDDLMTLALDEQQIVMARYELARLRTWRLYLVMFATRLATLSTFVLLLIYTFALGYNLFEGESLLRILVVTMAIVAIAVFLFLEPFWRIRGMTAMGLALATRRKHTTANMMYAFAVVVSNWIMKWFALGLGSLMFFAISYNVSCLVFWLVGMEQDNVIYNDAVWNYPILYFIGLIFMTRLYYEFVESTSLNELIQTNQHL